MAMMVGQTITPPGPPAQSRIARALRLIRNEALVDLDESGIEVTAGAVTAWRNSGTGGASYDLDTVVGTGANLKRHPSGSALFYGASGDNVSTPDTAAAPSGVTDLSLIVHCRADDWTPSTAQALLSKWGGSAATNSFQLYIDTSGLPTLATQGDGASANVITASSAATAIADGNGAWLAVSFDQSASEVTFYTSTDSKFANLADINWTQLGTVQTHVEEAIHDSTTPIRLGANGGGAEFDGAISRAYIIGDTSLTATPAISFDARDYVSGSTVVTDGTTWTLNGNTYIQNTGRDVVHTIGSAGLETTAGQTITSPGTVLGVFRLTNPSSGSGILVGARSVGTSRWLLGVDPGPVWQLFQGGTQITFGTADDEWHVWTGQFNGNATTKLTVSGEGSVTGNAGGQDWDAMTLFNNFPAGEGAEAACARLLVFSRALTDAEKGDIEYLLEKATL